MARPNLLTYMDAIEHVTDYGGGASDKQTERFARRAIQLALNTFQSVRNWTYFNQTGRIHTVAPYSTGSIAYDHTGGSSERLLTLTGGTWPVWAADGVVVIANIPYSVNSRLSSTTLELSRTSNPGEDITAGTGFAIYREAYTMPVDFGAAGEITNQTSNFSMQHVPFGELMDNYRVTVRTGAPCWYSFSNDPRRRGAAAIRFYPFPDAAYDLIYAYRRQSRQLTIDLYSQGTVAITDGQLTLTGSGTNWNSQMVGCMVRFPMDAASPVPTGVGGANPFFLERSIAAYVSPTVLTLDQDPQMTLSGVKYSISDPIDMEPGPMLTYFLRECEMQYRIGRRMAAGDGENEMYMKAKTEAMEADSPSFSSKSPHGGRMWPTKLGDFPLGS